MLLNVSLKRFSRSKINGEGRLWKNDLHATSVINSEKRLWRTCKSSTGGFNGETRLARMGRDDKGKDTEMA